MIKRILYLGYYIKELDKDKFKKFINHVSSKHHISKPKLYFDMLVSSVKYNISLNEYFLFHFYNSSDAVKKTWAGTGFMYEYQLMMNPRDKRKVMEDKLQFLETYGDFVLHDYASLAELQNPETAKRLLNNPSGKIVLKASDGQCGRGIEVRKSSDFTPETLTRRLKEMDNDFVEEFVEQHTELNRLSPSGLNTVRIVSQLTKDNNVDIIGARLRITVNSSVDNLAAGNIAAPIDANTGIVNGPAVYSDITKQDEDKHPITGVPITGFAVPYWQETIAMIKKAALLNTDNRSIGWDVAITNRGPELIEGNHDWCKLLWQLPVKKGLKNILLNYQKN